MAQQQTIKFTIRQDGTVTEEVAGVVGNQCEKLTEVIEKRLGNVLNRDHKPEYYQQQVTTDHVSLQHHQDDN